MNKGLKKGLKITGVTVAVILVFMLVLPFMFKDKVMNRSILVSFRIFRVRLSN